MKFDPTLPEDGINVTPSHPLSELTLLLGGSLALAVGLFLGLVLVLDRLIPLVPLAWEAKLFGGLAPDELAADSRQAAAARLLDRLVAQALARNLL